jgi:Na+/melibiose symporter-like transporter
MEAAMLLPPEEDKRTRRGSWRLIAIANIVILLSGLLVIWATGMIGSEIDIQGWIAIGIALVATSALGSVLMALSFYSSRSERDQAMFDGKTETQHTDSEYRRLR